MLNTQQVSELIRRRRRITGMSAVLLPFHQSGQVDWVSFSGHLEKTLEAGLIPAVNMDTGYINLLDATTRSEVLARTQSICSGRMFVAGAFVQDQPGQRFREDEYAVRMEEIQQAGGVPVIFQSFGLTQQADDDVVRSYEQLATHCDRFVGFELGQMFAPFGQIYSLNVFAGLMSISKCLGAKHSSLKRELEWERLVLRNATRPDFMVLTGNDLAIDMVMYGSDYLLGLSSFAPDLFALRDRLWADGSADFFEVNDVLQYLGFFAFRNPVPAYKHTAAMFLKLRGWIADDETHPKGVQRPSSDREILKEILGQLRIWEERSCKL